MRRIAKSALETATLRPPGKLFESHLEQCVRPRTDGEDESPHIEQSILDTSEPAVTGFSAQIEPALQLYAAIVADVGFNRRYTA